MKDKSGLKMVTDWWAASLKILGNPRLLDDLRNYDKESIDLKTVERIGNYLAEKGEDLKPEKVA